jgi:hypothetical protein
MSALLSQKLAEVLTSLSLSDNHNYVYARSFA